jgi:hypothetical protein
MCNWCKNYGVVFMQLGYSLDKRIQELEKKQNNPHQPKETENISVTDVDSKAFKKYSVPIGLLKYRLQNTRTLGHQIEYARRMNKETLFDDPESGDAQTAQHQILDSMLSENKLKSYFEAGRKQKNALLITKDGFVISGNRRLCCWRELYNKNSVKYSHFEFIDVCILEEENDSPLIDKIEALQETDESIQSRFAWFPVIMRFEKILDNYPDPQDGYKRIINLYMNSKYIRKTYESQRITEINEWIDTASLAKNMIENNNATLDFINDNEFAFVEWNKGFGKLQITKPLDSDLYNEIAKKVVLTDSSKVKIGRKYGFIKKVVGNFTQLKTRLIDAHKLHLNPRAENELIKIIKKVDADEIISDVKIHIDVITFNDNTKNKKQLAKANLERAQEHLKNSFDNLESDSDIKGFDARLKDIEIYTKKIISKIKKF